MPSERILVVEDEPLVARMLADHLALLAVELLHARNGEEALKLAREQHPDLILLDVMMPKLDGFEVAKILKQDPKTRHIPILFLTALDQVRDKVRGLELGADDYITKPFHPEELLARVRGVLRRARAWQELSGAIRGSLKAVSLPHLVQLLELEGRSGILILSRGEEQGFLTFRGGKLSSAILGKLAGEAAFFRLLDWGEGEFAFEMEEREDPPGAKLDRSAQELVLEGIQRKQSLERLKAHLPPLHVRLRASEKFQAILRDRPPPPGLRRFLTFFDGRRSIHQVLEQGGLDELRALEAIAELLSRGILEEA